MVLDLVNVSGADVDMPDIESFYNTTLMIVSTINACDL